MTQNYGNYGIFLIMGNAGFISSTVVFGLQKQTPPQKKKKQGKRAMFGSSPDRGIADVAALIGSFRK